MSAEPEVITAVEKDKLSECGHVEFLADNGLIYVDGLMNMTTGKTITAPILKELRDGRNGRLTVGSKWIQMLHCPICGSKLLQEQVGV